MFPLEHDYLNAKAEEHLNSLMWSRSNTASDIEAGTVIATVVKTASLARASTDKMSAAQTPKPLSDQIKQEAFDRFGWAWDNQEAPVRPVDVSGIRVHHPRLCDQEDRLSLPADGNRRHRHRRVRIAEGVRIDRRYMIYLGRAYNYIAAAYRDMKAGAWYIQLGCYVRTVAEWDANFWHNPTEFPNDGSEKSMERLRAYKILKAAINEASK